MRQQYAELTAFIGFWLLYKNMKHWGVRNYLHSVMCDGNVLIDQKHTAQFVFMQ